MEEELEELLEDYDEEDYEEWLDEELGEADLDEEEW